MDKGFRDTIISWLKPANYDKDGKQKRCLNCFREMYVGIVSKHMNVRLLKQEGFLEFAQLNSFHISWFSCLSCLWLHKLLYKEDSDRMRVRVYGFENLKRNKAFDPSLYYKVKSRTTPLVTYASTSLILNAFFLNMRSVERPYVVKFPTGIILWAFYLVILLTLRYNNRYIAVMRLVGSFIPSSKSLLLLVSYFYGTHHFYANFCLDCDSNYSIQ